MKSKFLLLIAFVTCYFTETKFAYSQSVSDHNGKEVFVVHSIKGLSSDITNNSFKLGYSILLDTSGYYFKNENADTSVERTINMDENYNYIHVVDGSGLNAELSVKDLPKSFDKFLTQANQPTVELRFGYIFNTVLSFNDWESLKSYRGFLGAREFSGYIGGFVRKSFITYYDTVSKQETDGASNLKKFLSPGINGDLTLYYARWFAVSLTASGSYGLSLDNLGSFQSNIPSVLNLDPKVISIGQPYGKIGGDIKKATINGRFSIGLPIFLKALVTKLRDNDEIADFKSDLFSKLYVLPHYAPYGSYQSHWTHQLGLSLNCLAKGYGGLNSTIVPAFGVGLDWLSDVKTHTGWGTGLFYITGSINLGNFVNNVRKGKEYKK